MGDSRNDQLESISKDDPEDLVNGPDTSSFTAFLYSLLASSEYGDNLNSDDQSDNRTERVEQQSNKVIKENSGKMGLITRGKQSVGRALFQVARIGGFRRQESKDESEIRINNEDDSKYVGVEMGNLQNKKKPTCLDGNLKISEPSKLLSEETRNELYRSLPALVQGRRWLLLYRF